MPPKGRGSRQVRLVKKNLWGSILWFDTKKGYGFLRANGDTSDQDIFLHWSDVELSRRHEDGSIRLEKGEGVLYDLAMADRGAQAIRIRSRKEIGRLGLEKHKEEQDTCEPGDSKQQQGIRLFLTSFHRSPVSRLPSPVVRPRTITPPTCP